MGNGHRCVSTKLHLPTPTFASYARSVLAPWSTGCIARLSSRMAAGNLLPLLRLASQALLLAVAAVCSAPGACSAQGYITMQADHPAVPLVVGTVAPPDDLPHNAIWFIDWSLHDEFKRMARRTGFGVVLFSSTDTLLAYGAGEPLHWVVCMPLVLKLGLIISSSTTAHGCPMW